MMKTMRIKDLISNIIDNRGKTPPTAETGYNLIEINSIAGKSKYPDYSLIKKHVSKETYMNWFRAGHPQIGDILIPTVGTLDAIGYMDRNDCCIAQNLIALRTNPSICDSQYLYYLLCWNKVRQELLNLDIGAVQPSIKVPHLKKFEVNIPDLNTQKKIGSILDTFDEKIKKNSDINKNLEAQAQAVLMHMLESNKGSTIVHLGDYLYIKGRIGWKGLKKSEYLTHSGFRIINGESLTSSGIDWNKAGHISKERYDESPEIMLQMGDILLSKDGTIGKIGYVDRLDTPTSVASGIFVIRNTKPDIISTPFIYYLLKSSLFNAFVAGRTEGSVIPHLYQKDFMEFEFPLPSKNEMRVFDNLIGPQFNMYFENQVENEYLSRCRDLLLPKLMSGDIDVSDIDI